MFSGLFPGRKTSIHQTATLLETDDSTCRELLEKIQQKLTKQTKLRNSPKGKSSQNIPIFQRNKSIVLSPKKSQEVRIKELMSEMQNSIHQDKYNHSIKLPQVNNHRSTSNNVPVNKSMQLESKKLNISNFSARYHHENNSESESDFGVSIEREPSPILKMDNIPFSKKSIQNLSKPSFHIDESMNSISEKKSELVEFPVKKVEADFCPKSVFEDSIDKVEEFNFFRVMNERSGLRTPAEEFEFSQTIQVLNKELQYPGKKENTSLFFPEIRKSTSEQISVLKKMSESKSEKQNSLSQSFSAEEETPMANTSFEINRQIGEKESGNDLQGNVFEEVKKESKEGFNESRWEGEEEESGCLLKMELDVPKGRVLLRVYSNRGVLEQLLEFARTHELSPSARNYLLNTVLSVINEQSI